MIKGKDVLARFFNLIEMSESSGCWEWIGGKNVNGYGNISVSSQYTMAHRLSYEIFIGDIPSGLVIDHLCRNHGCVNPDHLEAVTIRENILRGVGTASVHSKKTHCPKGHEYNDSNTYIRRGMRYCLLCRKDNAKNWYAKNREEILLNRKIEYKKKHNGSFA